MAVLNQSGKKKFSNPITIRRRLIQSVSLFLYFIFPFLGIFYIDLESTSFVLMGKTIGMNNSVIFLIGFVVLLTAVIAMAITTGRSFCGWLCPQNFLSEMINRYLLNSFNNKIISNILVLTIAIFISLMVSVNFLFYFGKPEDVINNLINGDFHYAVITFAVFFALIVFFGIGVFRHDFCKFACPYGIMQASVTDKNTLRVRFAKERSKDCIDCGACTDICYMKIEPRKLVQPDPGCMNCGLCVEACQNILEPEVKTMLSFTSDKKSTGQDLNMKANIILFSMLIFFSAMFLNKYFNLPDIDMVLSRDDSMVSKVNNNLVSSKYFLNLFNQTPESKELTLKLEEIENSTLSTENKIIIEANHKNKISLMVTIDKTKLKTGIYSFYISVYDKQNKFINKTKGSIFVP